MFKDDIHLSITVWGDAYYEKLMMVCLPSLMTENNLPELTKKCQHVNLHMQIDELYIDRFKSTPIFDELSQLDLQLNITPLTKKAFSAEPSKYAFLEAKQKELISKLPYSGYFGWICPDAYYPDGFLMQSLKKILAGKKLIIAPSIRLNSEAYWDEYIESTSKCYKLPSSKAILSFAVDNLHEISKQLLWGEYSSSWPSSVYFPFDVGVIVKCFHLHPCFSELSRVKHFESCSMDDKDFISETLFSMDEIGYEEASSGAIWMLELTNSDHSIASLEPREEKNSYDFIVYWSINQCSMLQRRIFKELSFTLAYDFDSKDLENTLKDVQDFSEKVEILTRKCLDVENVFDVAKSEFATLLQDKLRIKKDLRYKNALNVEKNEMIEHLKKQRKKLENQVKKLRQEKRRTLGIRIPKYIYNFLR